MSTDRPRRSPDQHPRMSATSCHKGGTPPPVHGMIDAHAHHNSGATCPLPLIYEQIKDGTPPGISPTKMTREWAEWLIARVYANGVKIQKLSTKLIGDLLVELNTRMFNKNNIKLKKTLPDYEETFQRQQEIKELEKQKNALPKTADGRFAPQGQEELTKIDNELSELRMRVDDFYKKRDEVFTKEIASLIIVPTMDMELAHLDGYKGEFIYREDGDRVYYRKRVPTGKIVPPFMRESIDISHEKNLQVEREDIDEDNALKFQKWRRQIKETELAAISNPLRLFPLFFYEPRRYRYSKSDGDKLTNDDLGYWYEPLARIVGYTDKINIVSEKSKIWFGFKMYPSLGYRPLDEFCKYLPNFYKECEAHKIPILAHCAPGGMVTHDARLYKAHDEEFINDYSRKTNRLEIDKKYPDIPQNTNSGVCQNSNFINSPFNDGEKISGTDKWGLFLDKELDYFYRTYGHPESWRPVLKKFPKLHLCLAHFGGAEWERYKMRAWAKDQNNPATMREWIKSMIRLAAEYDNVYIDISCINLNWRYTYNKDCANNPCDKHGAYNNNLCNLKVRDALEKLLILIMKDDCELKHLKNKLIFGSDWYLTYLTDIKKNAEYGKYCNQFKKLFDDVDNTGDFWERVSLINPWNCYSLSAEKFQKMTANLTAGKNTKPRFVPETLKLLCDFDKYVRHKSKRCNCK